MTANELREAVTIERRMREAVTPEIAIAAVCAAYPTIYPHAPRGEAFAQDLAETLAARMERTL